MLNILYYLFLAFMSYVVLVFIIGLSSGLIKNIKLRKKHKLWMLEREAERIEDEARRKKFNPAQLDKIPDYPCLYGYKLCWLEVNTKDSRKVVEQLQLEDVHLCNWNSSFQAIDFDYIFVSPPVLGWVFIVAKILPEIREYEGTNSFEELMERLAIEFSEVCYYSSHRVVSYYAWSKYVNGQEIRSFSSSEDGIYQVGEITKEELSLDKDLAFELFPDDISNDIPEEDLEDYINDVEYFSGEYIDEDDVLDMAELWSLNPEFFELMDADDKEKGVGFIGKLKI